LRACKGCNLGGGQVGDDGHDLFPISWQLR
jgi:hypothetical protein